MPPWGWVFSLSFWLEFWVFRRPMLKKAWSISTKENGNATPPCKIPRTHLLLTIYKSFLQLPSYHLFRTFVLKNADRYQPKSPAKKDGFAGPITEEKGFVSYAEICQLVSDGTWTKRTDADSNVYVTKGNQWAGYDTPNSVLRKVILSCISR